MKKKVVLAVLCGGLLLLGGFTTLTQVNFLDYQRPVPYNKINEITFKNFRGLEFFQNSLYGNERFAYINTSITYEFDGDSVSVESFFHPSSSYVYNKKAFSRDLLTHELYHFKIAELHARIAKKKISEARPGSQSEIESLIAETLREERSYQVRYDDDTFHSYVLREQKKHEREIDSLLHLYDAFKNPKIIYR